jgi:hypothetical protein
MTPAEMAARTRVAQGLPERVTDASTLADISALVTPTRDIGARHGGPDATYTNTTVPSIATTESSGCG